MTVPLWTSADVAAATSGHATAAFAATGISIDSRTAQKGDLFVALKGPNHDGHDHLASAFAAGAAAAMVGRLPAKSVSSPLLVVGDTMQAIEALGRAARTRSRAKVAAVTGSVGKTGTKEALRLALDVGARPKHPVHASAASLNNHIGVPLTLARLPQDADYAVIEIGMNHAGEITPLSRLARPNVAIITTVEAVHTGNFADGLIGVAAAKAEIFDGFDNGHGVAVLNRDNRFFDSLAERARSRGTRIVGFGSHAGADFRLVEFKSEATSSIVTASVGGKIFAYRIGVPGRHWAMNTLAVLAAADCFGVGIEAAAAAFARLTPPKGRGQRQRVTLADGDFELIDDSYNASPASMRAAFEVLRAAQPGQNGRRIAILGDMLELGDDAPTIHAALVEPLQAADIDLVFTCGPQMAHLHDALPAPRRGGHAASADALLPRVREELHAGDVAMVKGSRGSRMDRIVAALISGVGANGNGSRPTGRAVNG